jgi:hypothetical protein
LAAKPSSCSSDQFAAGGVPVVLFVVAHLIGAAMALAVVRVLYPSANVIADEVVVPHAGEDSRIARLSRSLRNRPTGRPGRRVNGQDVVRERETLML